MIKILGKIPNKVYLAFSGGVDSVAVAHFMKTGKKEVELLYFNHGTAFGKESEIFVQNFAKENNMKLHIGHISSEMDKNLSKEEYWRNERYNFFKTYNDLPIVMCHHLNDQMENWIFTSLHGNPMLIPYSNKNIIRPFIMNLKEEFISYSKQMDLSWIEDPSNKDISFMRNRIRHTLVDNCLAINPGLPKVLIKKIKYEFTKNCENKMTINL